MSVNFAFYSISCLKGKSERIFFFFFFSWRKIGKRKKKRKEQRPKQNLPFVRRKSIRHQKFTSQELENTLTLLWCKNIWNAFWLFQFWQSTKLWKSHRYGAPSEDQIHYITVTVTQTNMLNISTDCLMLDAIVWPDDSVLLLLHLGADEKRNH